MLLIWESSGSLGDDLLGIGLESMCLSAAQQERAAIGCVESLLEGGMGDCFEIPKRQDGLSWEQRLKKAGWDGRMSCGGTYLGNVIRNSLERFKQKTGSFPQEVWFWSDCVDMDPRMDSKWQRWMKERSEAERKDLKEIRWRALVAGNGTMEAASEWMESLGMILESDSAPRVVSQGEALALAQARELAKAAGERKRARADKEASHRRPGL